MAPNHSAKSFFGSPTHNMSNKFNKPRAQIWRELDVGSLHPQMRVVIALRRKREHPLGRRGKYQRSTSIHVKLTFIYPQPKRAYVGQEILHEIPLNCPAERWAHPQHVAASGPDGSENGNTVPVEQHVP